MEIIKDGDLLEDGTNGIGIYIYIYKYKHALRFTNTFITIFRQSNGRINS